MKTTLVAILLAALAFTHPAQAQAPKLDPENTLVIELKTGKVLIQMRPDIAPKHVERVKELTRGGFYNGHIFHRVIDGFMAQTGDPTGTGRGGSGRPKLPAEFTPTQFERGAIGAARGPDRNSADSQFFIVFKHSPHLNGEYTTWGRVVQGMHHVDQIARGEPPANPDKMLKVYVLADENKGAAKK
ncbi:MAG: peptidylprolyl isomerase [Hyphomicrobiaceae bacterium]